MVKKLMMPFGVIYKEFDISNSCDVLCVKLQYGEPVVYVNDRGTGSKTLCVATCLTGSDAPDGFYYLGTQMFKEDTFDVHYFYRIK